MLIAWQLGRKGMAFGFGAHVPCEQSNIKSIKGSDTELYLFSSIL